MRTLADDGEPWLVRDAAILVVDIVKWVDFGVLMAC